MKKQISFYTDDYERKMIKYLALAWGYSDQRYNSDVILRCVDLVYRSVVYGNGNLFRVVNQSTRDGGFEKEKREKKKNGNRHTTIP